MILRQLTHCYGLAPDQLRCLTDNPADGVYGFTQQEQAFLIKYCYKRAPGILALGGLERPQFVSCLNDEIALLFVT